jgi:2-aminomuconate deaminase
MTQRTAERRLIDPASFSEGISGNFSVSVAGGLPRPGPGAPGTRYPDAAMSQSINSPRAPEAVGAYPHARRVGNFLFLSGVGPRQRGRKEIPGVTRDAAGRVVSYDIEAQVRGCFENVRVILEDAGSSWAGIVDVQVFLTDMGRDFAAFNRLWAEYFPTDPPCRTTVEVGALPTPIAFEVKVIATVP